MASITPFVVIAITFFVLDITQTNFDPESIKNKRVLITGVSSGICEEIAYQYSRLGASVFITANNQTLLEKVAAKCKKLGAKQVVLMISDLSEEDNRYKVIDEVKKQFGSLDYIILKPIITSFGFWMGTKENMTALRRNLNASLISFVDLVSQALPMLTESKGSVGVVLPVNSRFSPAGLTSLETDNLAIHGFFSCLRQEFRLRNTGISVTASFVEPLNANISKCKLGMFAKTFSGFFKTTEEDAANAIIIGISNRKFEMYYGTMTYILVMIHKLFPGFIEDYFGKLFLE